MECQGECKKHGECNGEVREVVVYGVFCPTGMNFNYCQTAREEDERRGFTVEIPHETFDIFEDGEPFCRGIVFSVNDLK